MQDLELGDIDDHDTSFRKLELRPASQASYKPAKLTKIPSTPIDLKTAIVSFLNTISYLMLFLLKFVIENLFYNFKI